MRPYSSGESPCSLTISGVMEDELWWIIGHKPQHRDLCFHGVAYPPSPRGPKFPFEPSETEGGYRSGWCVILCDGGRNLPDPAWLFSRKRHPPRPCIQDLPLPLGGREIEGEGALSAGRYGDRGVAPPAFPSPPPPPPPPPRRGSHAHPQPTPP